MKLIESKYDIIPQESGLEGIYKQCEIAGRTAYKSEDKITDGSAKRFVDAMMKSNHGAVLEHGTVYLKQKAFDEFIEENGEKIKVPKDFTKYDINPYSRFKWVDGYFYVTTNLRVLYENNWLDDLKYLCEPTEHHEKRVTVKFTCSRSIAQEITRHREFSFLMESQRYCGYNKSKFDGEVTFIIPEWVKDTINDTAETIDSLTGQRKDYLVNMPMADAVKQMTCESRAVNCWYESMKKAEDDYMYLIIEEELKPEEARGVLTNDCKTELIMTGYIDSWKHFFDLRALGTTGKPHPDIRVLACLLRAEFILRGYFGGKDIIKESFNQILLNGEVDKNLTNGILY